MEKAIFFSYPSIFIEIKEFVEELVEREVVLSNVQNLLRMIVG